jgi:hypothetical protein
MAETTDKYPRLITSNPTRLSCPLPENPELKSRSMSTYSQINLKRSYQIVSPTGKTKGHTILVDTARNGLIVARGSYRSVYAAARKLGLTHS